VQAARINALPAAGQPRLRSLRSTVAGHGNARMNTARTTARDHDSSAEGARRLMAKPAPFRYKAAAAR
jgi:hypothetical protein